MAIADISRVGATVAWIIGARDDSFHFAVDDDRFTLHEIANAIIETETELIRDFAEAYHPQRTDFLEWLPANGMTSGDNAPSHVGQIEAVRMLPAAFPGAITFLPAALGVVGDGVTIADSGFYDDLPLRFTTTGSLIGTGIALATTYYITNFNIETGLFQLYTIFGDTGSLLNITGQGTGVHTAIPQIQESDWSLAESTTRTNIREWNENPTIFADIDGFFNLTNETLEFTGRTAQVKVVDYTPDYPTLAVEGVEDEEIGSLQIDDIWEGGLVAGAVVKLAKIGVPAGVVTVNAGRYAECRQMIRQGLTYKPEIDTAQKIQ